MTTWLRWVLMAIATTALQTSGALEGADRPSSIPFAFIVNEGQWDHRVRHAARIQGVTVLLMDRSIVLAEPGRQVVRLEIQGEQGAWMPTPGSRVRAGYHFFLGNDPERWRSNVSAFSSLVYRRSSGDLILTWRVGRLKLHVGDAAGAHLTSAGMKPGELRTDWKLSPGAVVTDLFERVFRDGAKHQVTAPSREWRLESNAPHGLEWSTYLGGSLVDEARAAAFTPDGGLVVAGNTASIDFPVTQGAFDTEHGGGSSIPRDVFVARFDQLGELMFATYVGGSNNETPEGVGVDEQGRILFGGDTVSNDYPITPGAFDTIRETTEGIASALSPDGSELLFSTFCGGAEADFVRRAYVDHGGHVTLVGHTASPDFPITADAVQRTLAAPGSDVFVARVSPDGGSLAYSTYLGGTSSDLGEAVHVSDDGVITLSARVSSTDFPVTPGSHNDHTPTGAVVARIDPVAGLVYSTYVAGDPFAIDVDPSGAAVIAGTTDGNVVATPGAFQTTEPGLISLFVTRLDPAGSDVIYTTFVGGSQLESGARISVDRSGSVTVAGKTRSLDFPTTLGAFDTLKENFGWDVVAVRLSPDGTHALYSTLLGGLDLDAGAAPTVLGLDVDAYGRVALAGPTFSTDFPVTPGAFDTDNATENKAFVSVLTMLPLGVERYGASASGIDEPLAIGIDRMPQPDGELLRFTCTNAPPASLDGLLLVSAAALDVPQAVGGVSAALWVDPGALLALLPARSDALGWGLTRVTPPDDPVLVGFSLAAQFLWRDPADPASVLTSNALLVTIQP